MRFPELRDRGSRSYQGLVEVPKIGLVNPSTLTPCPR